MTPVAFALFILAMVWPLQRRLRMVLPQVIAVLVTAAVALLAIAIGGWLVFWGFGRIAQWVIANAPRLQSLYMHAADLLERRGLYAAELFAEQVNVLWLVQVLRAIGGSLQGVLSFSIVTFVFVILGLLEVEALGRRLLRDRRRTGWCGRDRRSNGDRCAIADLHAGSFLHERADGAGLLGLHRRLRARAATRMGRNRLRSQLHTFYRLVRCHPSAYPVRSRAVRNRSRPLSSYSSV